MDLSFHLKTSNFVAQWKFSHITSSPSCPQANGKVKSAVKSGSDPLLALLALCNTPMEGLQASPAQLLYSRRCRTLLPITAQLLQPAVVSNAREGLKVNKAKQVKQYNKQARDLPPLNVGDNIRMQTMKRQPEWKKGVVVDVLPHRAYEVDVGSDKLLRRNRQQLRYFQEKSPDQTTQESQSLKEDQTTSSDPDFPLPSTATVSTPRSGTRFEKTHQNPLLSLFHETAKASDKTNPQVNSTNTQLALQCVK